MKKVFLAITVIGTLAFTACKNEKSAEATVESTETTTADQPVIETTTETTATTKIEVPNFSSAEVQSYANDYADFIAEVAAASKAGDQEKLNNLMKEQVEWAQKTIQINQKMTAEDVKKWTDWEAKIKQEIQ